MLLRPRITITFLLLAVVPILLIGVLTYGYVKASMEKSVLNGIHVIAELKEASLFLYLGKLNITTKSFASDGYIRDGIETLANHDSDEQNVSDMLNQHLIINKLPLNADISHIDILSLDGVILSSTKINRIGLNSSAEPYYSNVKNDVYVNDVMRNDEGKLEIALSAPLFSRTNSKNQVGILVNHFTIKSIKDLFDGTFILNLGAKTQSRGLGTTGETYLVNNDKLMINDSIFIKNSSFKQYIDTYPVKMNIEHGREVIGVWKDYRGVEVIGASMSIVIDDLKWTLITEQDADEAFIAVENLKQTYAIIIIFITVLTLITSIFTSKMITQPLVLLTRRFEDLARGGKHTQIIEIQRNDEIGILANSFEKMSLNLNNALEEVQNKNEQLEALSNCDGLTGLINHRYLLEILETEFNRSFRYNTPLCCIMLDIDFFKEINDTYGHLFGDVVIKGVANIIKEKCRNSDLMARYGGEEFVVLLPNTDIDQAQTVAVKLFEAIKSFEFTDNENSKSITVSIGLSSINDTIERSIDLIALADKSMYEAKNGGRNRICVSRDKGQAY